ncbi:MAG: ribonucleoside-diphosphate reductase, adenosylcobalamin-dependent [Candidatus Altiarchaeales archaeon WOR_SM1_86-2]|nr:MAG: ribonucleoside-diphosphate reductase, adenosylcobalamin-dependent [Candidatus Altiarchaeales archaeon WOR_SM1_86-2]
MAISKIRKRDGSAVKFERQRITDAVHRALVAVEAGDGKTAEKISDEAVRVLEKKFAEEIPSVEDAQNTVIEVLRNEGCGRVADEYSAYRNKKEEIRKLKQQFGIEAGIKLGVNAVEVLKKRYLLRNKKGEVIETPAKMFGRAAETTAKVDERYGGDSKKSEEEFYGMMSRLEFLPNSPTMFNACAPLGQLSACFVLPVGDSLDSIFTAVKNTALIEQSGGGVGFDFSKLRPGGDIVRSTKGVASGPVSFMRVFDAATDVIKAGGKRRGAMMGILRVDHPDILEFITVKAQKDVLTNFNISAAVTDDFMKAVEEDGEYSLVNPRTGKAVRKLRAGYVWDLIAGNAWKCGDPGVIFIDEINRHNPTPEVGKLNSTNPCGEAALLPYESCNLGSINLSKIVAEEEDKPKIDWKKLEHLVKTSVHFLDNVIDANIYPLPEIDRMTKANRKIGLGVMGWAEFLIRLGIPYDSEKAVELGEKIMKFISETGRKKSRELGEKRGSFPNFDKSIFYGKYRAMRNATVTTIAPTGTISIIAGCSSGIEPLFAVSFMRHVLEGTRLFEVNPLFERTAKERKFYSARLLEKIAKDGSVQKIKNIPEDVRRLFVTALDIKPEWHVRTQAAFQKYTNNAVSKTINLPHDAEVADVKKVYGLAWKLKCKGVTVYRYGSKPQQVLYIGEAEKKRNYVSAESDYAGGCPSKTCPIV